MISSDMLRSPLAMAKGGVTPLPEGLLDAVMRVESGGNPGAVSPRGAQGLFQFMPATAKDLGIDPFDPGQSREGAQRYLAWLLERTGGLDKALAGWNWGIGNVEKKGMENLPKETRDFVRKIYAELGRKPIKTPISTVGIRGNAPEIPEAAPKVAGIRGNTEEIDPNMQLLLAWLKGGLGEVQNAEKTAENEAPGGESPVEAAQGGLIHPKNQAKGPFDIGLNTNNMMQKGLARARHF